MLLGGRYSRPKAVHQIRPYDIRVVRDRGGGLWELEDSKGQLYLAVLGGKTTEDRRRIEEARRADGSAYRHTA